MSKKENDYLYDAMYEMADTVILLEEVDLEVKYKEESFNLSLKNMNLFFEQVDEKLKKCSTKEEENFVKETTLNFLVFSLKKLIVEYDCPDENIDFFANHIKQQILKLKRVQNDSTN